VPPNLARPSQYIPQKSRKPSAIDVAGEIKVNPRELSSDVAKKSGPSMTNHAWSRCHSRGLSTDAIDAAIQYGRLVHVRGAAIHVIGKKEVQRFAAAGVDLKKFEGVQVVCNADDCAIMTVYRNHDLRGLRPHQRRSHH
jgi:hypothetical protein